MVGDANGSGTFSGVITNSGNTNGSTLSFTKTGNGVEVLSGANNFTGATTISGGTLEMANSNALQATIVTDNVTSNGLTFLAGLGTANIGGLSGSGNIALADLSGGSLTLNVNGTSTSTTTYSGALSGIGGLNNGGGTLVLTNSSSNYSGPTTISGGALVLGNTSVLTSAWQHSGSISVTGAGSTFAVQGGTAVGEFSPGNIAVAASNVSFGAGTNLGIQVTDAAPFTLTNPISGAQGLVKYGAGTLAMSATSTYTGRTTIAAGTVLLGAPASYSTISLAGSSGNWTNATATTQTNAYTISASGSLPEALVVDVDDRVASATAPTVTYNGVALTQAIGAIDPNGGNYVNSYVFYLASTASGFITGSSKNLVVTYPAAPTDSEIEAFTLAGVNLAKMPGTALANSTGTAGTGSTNSITVTTTVTVPGSWVAFDANYRTENATPPAVVAETPTFGTRLTTGNGGSAANGNFWEEEGAGTDIVGAGALIQTSGATGVLSLTESDSAQSNGRETMIGAVFQPQQLTAGSTGALPVTALTLASGATLDLDGNSQTLVSLSDLTPGQGGTIQNSGGAGTLTLSTTGGSTTFSGLITGGISLIMSGSGYQTLAGVNTYTGSTSITGGTLQVGNGATGSLATSGITLSNGGVLNIDSAWTLTTANFISGTGSVVKSGTGALTLEAANSYSLGTTITGGTVAMGTFDGPNENVNALGSGPVSISNNALLSFGGAAGGVVNYSFSNALNVNGGIIFGEDGYNQLGTVTIGAGGLKVDTQWGGKDVAIAQLAGSGPLTIDSAPINNSAPVGIVHVSGSAGYTGTITINPAGVTSLVGTSGVGNGGELEVDSAAALTDASVVMNSTRGMVFNVGNPVFGSLSGSGAMALTSSAAFGTLTVGGVNTNTTYSGVLSGSGGLLKVGSGAMVLGSAETFTGGMTINGGTVQLNAASSFPANTLVTVNAGATLLGNAQDNVYNAGCNLVINDGTYYQASAANRSSLVLVTMTGGTITSGPTSPDALGNICINGTVNATSDAAGNPALINATLVGLNAGAGGSIFNVTRGTGAVDLLITSNIIDTSANPNTPLVKNGSGILALAGSNRYTAGTVLNAGILQLGNIAALGANTAP